MRPVGISLRTILIPLSSLKLTVALLAMSIVLVFVGTLAQVDRGIWSVMGEYFRSPYVLVPFQLFFPRHLEVPGAFPFPGGYTIGLMMLVNLLAAHALRFKIKVRGALLVGSLVIFVAGAALITWFHNSPAPGAILTWGGGYAGVLPLLGIGSLVYAPAVLGAALLFGRRCGIMLIHASLLLLLVGEGITAATALEAQMPIYEGSETRWAHDIREVELAVIDHSDPQRDRVVVVSEAALRRAVGKGTTLRHDDLPFGIRVDRYLPNCQVFRLPEDGSVPPVATHGLGLAYGVVETDPVSGVDGQTVDLPAALVTLMPEAEAAAPIGRYLVSPHFQADDFIATGQAVRHGDRTYMVYLRFRRYYKPYAVRLIKFSHDRYPGTNVPRNFSSDIRLRDPQNRVDRQVHISMNHPLRYRGETFFQASWIAGKQAGQPDRGTVLMVVRNPGWTVPYIACAGGGLGLLIHFGLSLTRFLRRQRT